MKLGTYVVLLPLVLLQLAGTRWSLGSQRWSVGAPAGFAVGVLYATTTISGPPLSLLLGAQKLSPEEFRASMAMLRVLESVSTLVLFVVLGLSFEKTWATPAGFDVISRTKTLADPSYAALVKAIGSPALTRLTW